MEDGDLSLLLNLPGLREVSFKDRRHYTDNQEDIMQPLMTRRTWGPGAFENERAVRWGAEDLGRQTDAWDPLRVVGFTVAAITNLGGGAKSRTGRMVLAAVGQTGIAAAEIVASLIGRSGERMPGSEAADHWVRSHRGVSVPTEVVTLARNAMDRVAEAPSGLRDLSDARRGLREWREAVTDLRDRLAE